jgi:hypothetical protein
MNDTSLYYKNNENEVYKNELTKYYNTEVSSFERTDDSIIICFVDPMRQNLVLNYETDVDEVAKLPDINYNDHQLDFILIRQKDYIISLIDNRRLVEARCCLRTVSELWLANNYEYKLNELAQRIRNTPRRKEED